MKIVVLESLAVNPGDLSWDWLKEYGEVTLYERLVPREQTMERVKDAEVLLLNKTPVDEAMLQACPSLRLICVQATGYNVVDCDAATAHGVAVCNVPDYGTSAVAQFTFALLLEMCHQVGHHDRLVHGGRWSACPDFCFWDTPQTELAGMTMGIVGFGRIGRAVAAIARAFGMHVLAYSRNQTEQGRALAEYVPLEELLAKSDVVSLHCPLTPQTTGLMNAETIGRMRSGAMLINTSRGPVVDEAALAEALRTGKLRCAAVDVATVEPIPADSPLLSAPNCIITPHMAWAPTQSRQRIMNCVEGNIRGFLAGAPVNLVNTPRH